jgi:putative SOS response-associated peptidase YedK
MSRLNPPERWHYTFPNHVCGRYDFFPGEFSDLRIRFILEKHLPDFKPSYNIAPGKDVPVIVRNSNRSIAKLMRWGPVPSWAQDTAVGNQMINARYETLDQKPSFNQLLRRNRCLMPADGFFYWRRARRDRPPMRVRMKDRRPFTMAGLWDVWWDPDWENFTRSRSSPRTRTSFRAPSTTECR